MYKYHIDLQSQSTWATTQPITVNLLYSSLSKQNRLNGNYLYDRCMPSSNCVKNYLDSRHYWTNHLMSRATELAEMIIVNKHLGFNFKRNCVVKTCLKYMELCLLLPEFCVGVGKWIFRCNGVYFNAFYFVPDRFLLVVEYSGISSVVVKRVDCICNH